MGTRKPLSCSSLRTAGWWETVRWVLTGPDCLDTGQCLDIVPMWLPSRMTCSSAHRAEGTDPA